MRNAALFAVVFALAAACTFEIPIDWDALVFAAPDGEDGRVPDVNGDDASVDADQQGDSALVDVQDVPDVLPDVKDSKDAYDVKDTAEVVNPCPEGEYPDPQLMKCLKYPCCEIGGPWMLQMQDVNTVGLYEYAIAVEQKKALVVLSILGRAQGDVILPETVNGTLEDDIFHLDGGDPGITGFLIMDAKKVEKQLFELSEIVGSYKLVINGEPTKSGPWTLTPN